MRWNLAFHPPACTHHEKKIKENYFKLEMTVSVDSTHPRASSFGIWVHDEGSTEESRTKVPYSLLKCEVMKHPNIPEVSRREIENWDPHGPSFTMIYLFQFAGCGRPQLRKIRGLQNEPNITKLQTPQECWGRDWEEFQERKESWSSSVMFTWKLDQCC